MALTNKRESNVSNNKHWTGYLSHDIYMCLAQCQTNKRDLPILLDAKWQWVQDTGRYNGYTKEDILVDILDLLDYNGLESVTELTIEEWKNLIK